MLERLIWGYIGLCICLYGKEILSLRGKKGDEKIEKMLESRNSTDILAVISIKNLKVSMLCLEFILLPLLPFIQAYEYYIYNFKKED